MDNIYKAKQIHRALELFAATVTDESTMMEIADVYPVYVVGKLYKTGEVFRHGLNNDGESQLYQVLQDHTSAAEWLPAASPSLYKAVGITDTGVPIWTQPLGSTDSYQTGDVVSHKDSEWESDIDNNVWEPGVYGWTKRAMEG